MKLTGARLNAYLRAPDPAVPAVLLYGPDRGLVGERLDLLTRAVAEDPSDPFRVIDLPAGALRDDPARLADEAAAMAFGGGRRVVRVREATDALAPALSSALETLPEGAAAILIEAGELSPRSALRKLAEGGTGIASVACYADDARSLPAVIAETLKAHGLSVSREAMAYLAENLGADRAVTRQELEKLALYMGGAGRVELADAQACVGDSGANSLDDVAFAAGGGDLRALDRALGRAFSEGQNPVSILRAVGRHITRLHQARALAARGRSPQQALAALRPPVIFFLVDRFKAQMNRWDERALGRAQSLLIEAELACKSTGTPAEAACGQALIALARLAPGARRGV